MSSRIEVTIFNEVSGGIKGVAVAFFGIGVQNEKRICHAYLKTGGPEITISAPKIVPENQIDEMLGIIREFYKKVYEL